MAEETKRAEEAKKKEKMVKIRFRTATAGLGYAQGKWYDVTESEYKHLRAYRFWPRHLSEEERKKVAGTPLNIEEFEGK